MKTNRVMIIGSRGFLGSHIFSALKADKHGVDVVEGDANVHFTKVSPNLKEFGASVRQFKPTVCINASGSASVGKSFESPETDFELNVRNVEIMLNSLKGQAPECKFINISSAAVYGTPEKLPITEDTAAKANPLSPYGKHKRQAELMLEAYANDFGLRTLSVRIFSCYGIGQRKLLFWDILEKIRASQSGELIMFGTGNESRDFIDVRDVMLAIQVLAAKADFNGSAINLATGIDTTIRDAVNMAIDVLGLAGKIKVNFTGEERVGDPKNWCADISKLKALGYQPNITLNKGLIDYYGWVSGL